MKKIILLNRKNLIFAGLIGFLGLLVLLLRVNNNSVQDQGFPFDKLTSIEISSVEYPYFTLQVQVEDIYSFTNEQRFTLSEGRTLQPGAVPPAKTYQIKFRVEAGRPLESGKTAQNGDRLGTAGDLIAGELIVNYSLPLGIFYYDDLTVINASSDFQLKTSQLISLYEKAAYNKYGLLLPWSEADKIFHLFSFGKITDLHTGASFMVKRRAGSSHADAQPLTAKDTAAMKKIFGGSWTWDRKAIIVEANGYRIAASMNGMPHGAGKIAGNNFPGHFCIHFLNSTTHSGSMDLRHQKEILKAAGKLPID